MKHIGKMLILTFEDYEENMIDWIVSCLGIGVKSFQIQNTKTEKLKFRDLRIDFSCRKVIKNNRQECTTAAAVVRILGGKFLEVHRMEFLYLFVVSILVGSPLQYDGQLSSNNFQNGIELFSGSQTVSSISPPFHYDLKSVYRSHLQ